MAEGPAGIIELIGGALVALGLFSRYAAFICSGEMAIAYFLAHWAIVTGSPHSFYPVDERRCVRDPVLLCVPLFRRLRPRPLGFQSKIAFSLAARVPARPQR